MGKMFIGTQRKKSFTTTSVFKIQLKITLKSCRTTKLSTLTHQDSTPLKKRMNFPPRPALNVCLLLSRKWMSWSRNLSSLVKIRNSNCEKTTLSKRPYVSRLNSCNKRSMNKMMKKRRCKSSLARVTLLTKISTIQSSKWGKTSI